MKKSLVLVLLFLSTIAQAKESVRSIRVYLESPEQDLLVDHLPFVRSVAIGGNEIIPLLQEPSVLKVVKASLQENAVAFQKADKKCNLVHRGVNKPEWIIAGYDQGSTGIYLGISIPMEYDCMGQATQYRIISISTDDYEDTGSFNLTTSTAVGFDPSSGHLN